MLDLRAPIITITVQAWSGGVSTHAAHMSSVQSQNSAVQAVNKAEQVGGTSKRRICAGSKLRAKKATKHRPKTNLNRLLHFPECRVGHSHPAVDPIDGEVGGDQQVSVLVLVARLSALAAVGRGVSLEA